MYGPLLDIGKPKPSAWALKKNEFSKAFFDHIVLSKTKTKVKITRAYWMLVLFRVLLTCMPQTGYIHPDEFFQTIEPIAGHTLGVEWKRSWEFNETEPIRNIMLPQLTVKIPLMILQFFHHISTEYFEHSLLTPYFVLIAPRLLYCALSFVNDYCLFAICRLYGRDYNKKLIFSATSHVSLVYATHTFSNSIEMVLVSLLYLFVSECMLTTGCVLKHDEFLTDKCNDADNLVERIKWWKLKKLLPNYSLRRCLLIATVAVVGTFNRPTFVAFAFPSVFMWFMRGIGSKYVTFKEFNVRLFIFLMCSLPSLIFLILYDSLYYLHLTMNDIGRLKISLDNFVVTPINFLRYNLLSDNLAQHGVHPRWLHALVNMPMLFNILAVIFFCLILRTIYRLLRGQFKNMSRIQSIDGLMGLSIIIPLGVLSLFPHQEPRFLIPLQLPLIFLCVETLNQKSTDGKLKIQIKSTVLLIWFTCNIFLTVFFGFFHQGGVYPAMDHIHKEVQAKSKFITMNVITSHIYDMPQTLLLTDDTSRIRINHKTKKKYRLSKRLFLYELGSEPIDYLVKHSKEIWDSNEDKLKSDKQQFRLYVLLPTSLKKELNEEWARANLSSTVVLQEEKVFFSHFSTEAPPFYPESNDPSCLSKYKYKPDTSSVVKLTKLQRILCFVKQFSLTLYRVEKYSHFLV